MAGPPSVPSCADRVSLRSSVAGEVDAIGAPTSLPCRSLGGTFIGKGALSNVSLEWTGGAVASLEPPDGDELQLIPRRSGPTAGPSVASSGAPSVEPRGL